MPAVTTNLDIEQGVDWTHGWFVRYNSVAITSAWVAHSQIRRHTKSTNVLHEFDIVVNDNGTVVVSVDNDESMLWKWDAGVYDVFVTSPDDVQLRIAEGKVTLHRAVTRE